MAGSPQVEGREGPCWSDAGSPASPRVNQEFYSSQPVAWSEYSWTQNRKAPKMRDGAAKGLGGRSPGGLALLLPLEAQRWAGGNGTFWRWECLLPLAGHHAASPAFSCCAVWTIGCLLGPWGCGISEWDQRKGPDSCSPPVPWWLQGPESCHQGWPIRGDFLSFFFFLNKFIYFILFWVALGLRCCTRAFL